MRIKLKKQREFFKEILSKEKINLIQLSKKLKLNYSNLKQYSRAERTIPEHVFSVLISLSPNSLYWDNNKIILKDNWGLIKGGINAGKSRNIKDKLAYARKFRKIIKVKIILNETFCEFYGMLLGDGCISRFKNEEGFERLQIAIVCNKKLDSEYLKSWREILKREYRLNPYYYEHKEMNFCRLTINNKGFCLDLNNKLDVPIGLKYDKLKISNKILALPWAKKKYVLRGLFDTDGIIFARKDESYKYPHVSITSKSHSFLMQIKNILREQGYPAYINGVDVRVKGIENVRKWFSDIGSSNPRNIKKYKYFLKHGNLPPQSLGLW